MAGLGGELHEPATGRAGCAEDEQFHAAKAVIPSERQRVVESPSSREGPLVGKMRILGVALEASDGSARRSLGRDDGDSSIHFARSE